MALGAQSVYAEDFERLPVEGGQSDVRDDLSEEDRKPVIVYKDSARVAMMAEDAAAGVRDIPPGKGPGISIGTDAYSVTESAVAIGKGASATGSYGVAIGNAATTGTGAVSIGNETDTVGYSVAIGNKAKAGTLSDLASGGSRAVAVGAGAEALAKNSIALGADSIADKENTVSVGGSSSTRVITRVGNGAIESGSTDAVTGDQLYTTNQSVSSLSTSLSSTNSDVALVKSLLGDEFGKTQIGTGAVAARMESIAVGSNAATNARSGIAIGSGASVGRESDHNMEADLSVALGANAKATSYSSVALGAGSVADRDNVVAVGSAVTQRQITNVGAGTQANDAVNLGQISTLLGGSVATDENGNVVNPSYQIGETSYTNVKAAVEAAAALASTGGTPNAVVYDDADHNKLTLGGTGAPVVALTNVANGVGAHDAVNAGQLQGVADIIGAGIAQDGSITKPIYTINGKQFSTVEDALKEAASSGGSGTGNSPSFVHVVGLGADGSLGNDASVGTGDPTEVTAAAIGVNSAASGPNAIAVGLQSKALSDRSVAIGSFAQTGSDQKYSVAIGSYVTTGGENALAIGSQADANANNAIALGNSKVAASGEGSIAFGSGATTAKNTTNSIAFGTNAKATVADAIALGANSVADRAGALSIGSSTAQRQIINVAAGTRATDAVNYGQLARALGGDGTVGTDGSVTSPEYVIAGTTYSNVKDAVEAAAQVGADENSVSYDGADRSLVTLQGENGSKITNLADGALNADSTDAVNGSQLFATNKLVADNTTAIGALGEDVKTNTTDIGDLKSGKAGLIQQASEGANITVAAGLGGEAIDFGSADGARVLKGVAAGSLSADSTEAVNGAQLIQSMTDVKDELKEELAGGSIDLKYVKVKATGTAAQATGAQSVAIGSDSAASGSNSLAMGAGARAMGANSVAIGKNSVAKDDNVVSVGSVNAERKIVNVANGVVSADSTDAVNGSQLQAAFDAIDAKVGAQNDRLVSLKSSFDAAPNYVAVAGLGSDGSLTNEVSVGTGDPTEVTAAAMGVGSAASGPNAIAVGLQSKALSDRSVAIGSFAQTGSDQKYSVAIGSFVTTGGENALAIGSQADANANNAIALGNSKVAASGEGSIAFGSGATTAKNTTNSIAFGTNAKATVADAIALGANSVADRAGALSIGSSTAQRQIINVAAGTRVTDAVNYGQLARALGGDGTVGTDGSVTSPEYVIAGTTYSNVKDAVEAAAQVGGGDGTGSSNAVVYDDAERSKLTLGGASAAPVMLTNIAKGAITATSTDAVNGSQLHGTVQSVATAISDSTTVGSDGKLMTSINVNGQDYTTVEGAIQAAAQTGSGVSAKSVLYDNEERTQLTLGGLTKAGAAVKLTNVANGAIAAGSSDAVNGAQVYDAAQSIASTIGGGTTVSTDGKLANTSIEVNGDRYDTVEGAIKAAAKSSATDSMAVKYDDDSRTRVTLGGTGATAPIVLSNVANGVNQYDAVNFGQLSELASKVHHVDGRVSILEQAPAGGSSGSGGTGGATGSTADWDLDAGGEKITNVGSATEKTDAVNLGQMNDAIKASVGLPTGTTAKDYTDQQIQGVRGQINDVSKNAYSGIAAATALTMIPGVDPGKTLSFGIGGATYKGYQAVAFGGEARINQNLKVKAGVGLSSGGNTVGMGASYQW
ncbi:beta strand repeat-containing protein [Burkholderia multivorans]|uniref:beta strand repeat-containing protein n=1 Tax=Burkholderia multivorans TaxID=87883 RepID=UPI0015E3A353|nr:YadA-like family protein [Burkholderia multivorans]